MRTFETAQDVLDNAKELHHLAGELYEKLQDEAPDERARMLLGYMIDHEKKMEENITRYEVSASKSILGTWMQYTLEEPPKRFIETLEFSQDMSIDEIADMGQQVDTYLVNLFEEVTETAPTNNMQEIFQSLMVMEEEEKLGLTRAANALWEL